MDTLLGEYDTDDEKAAAGAAVGPPAPAAARAARAVAAVVAGAEGGGRRAEAQDAPASPLAGVPAAGEAGHGPRCACDDCDALLARLVAKSLQTKGIRFKCRLCSEVMAAKAEAAGHFSGRHCSELQAFKLQKSPKLFEALQKAAQKASPKISFAREDILKKRPVDEDASFGGWAKKEKPEPPPCERPEYQAEMEPVLTAPPWANQTKPSNENASQMDREVDQHIATAQMKRFSRRNVLEVNPMSVRCKLCFKIIGTLVQAEQHVIDAHHEDFQKELQVWERFLYTTCKRQPPFGWVCKVCTVYFPSDGDVWRHLGKEVFVRREERHVTAWHEKEDRWGHEEDGECCGDGITFARGMSYDSVKKFQDEARRQQEEKEAKAMGVDRGDAGEDSAVENEEEQEKAEEVGVVKLIQEF